MTTTCQQLLLNSLSNFYKAHEDYGDILIEIISGKSRISLRVLDWFVTHYAKMKKVLYWIDDETKEIYTEYPNTKKYLRKILLEFEYRIQLQSYTKMYFDPFRRHDRIKFKLGNKEIETTVGQLNFFKWAIHNCIIDYVRMNIKDIEDVMSAYQKNLKKEDKPKKRKQIKTTNMIMSAPCQISFD